MDRLKVIRILVLILFSILIIRAFQLQIVSGDYYYQLSEGNRISLRPINSPRGKIIDKNGNILVYNKLSYNLYLLPNEIPPDYSVDKIFSNLSKLTSLKYQQLEEAYKKYNKKESPSAILLKRNISRETMVIIKENYNELPGILVKESTIRDYVYGNLASHLLGYVGEISIEELKKLTKAGYDYSGGDIVGKTGLEKEYEVYLKGIEGIEQIEVNSLGQKVKSLGVKPPVPGNNLILNIDLELQEYMENLLQKEFMHLVERAKDDPELHKPTGAAAIVMDPNTGKIMAMASIPNYNLQNFADGLSIDEYNDLINNSNKPLLNRPIMATVPPGSIFKLVTGTAAIEYLGIDTNTTFIDKNGKFYVPGWSRPYDNWHPGGEGKLDFAKAIARSNNVVFYELGYRLYKRFRGDKLQYCAKEFGLGSATGIDLPGEKNGLVPDESWKKRIFNEGWYPGDSVNLSIGQGGLLTTPIQLINLVSAIANGGILYRPYVVDKVISPDGKVLVNNKPKVLRYLPFDDSTYQILRKGMVEVTNAEYPDGMRGTATSVFKEFPVKVAGKTGTAQTGVDRPNHGFFVGYAPVDKPQVVVLVFLENGNSSAYTLPIAAGIFKSYFGFSEQEIIQEEEINDANGGKSKLLDYFKKVFSSDN